MISKNSNQTLCGTGPPDGCLQWLEGVTGSVQSFNAGGTGTHLAGQEYTVCVRRERSYCTICWSAEIFQIRNGWTKTKSEANGKLIHFISLYCWMNL